MLIKSSTPSLSSPLSSTESTLYYLCKLKNDSFQIMYEIFEDDNGKKFETGKVIFADLVLRGQNNPLYYFGKKGASYGYFF